MKKRFDGIDTRLDTIQNMCETVIQQTANNHHNSPGTMNIEPAHPLSHPARSNSTTPQNSHQLSSVDRHEFDSAVGKMDQLHDNFDNITKQLVTLNSMFSNNTQ